MDAGLIVTTEVGIEGLGAMASAMGGSLVTVTGTGGVLRSVTAATSVIVGACSEATSSVLMGGGAVDMAQIVNRSKEGGNKFRKLFGVELRNKQWKSCFCPRGREEQSHMSAM